jgi:hypothetical protein
MRQALQQELQRAAAAAAEQEGGAADAISAAPSAPPFVSECQVADMAALTPSEILEMVAWAAACPRGDKTARALAAAAAAEDPSALYHGAAPVRGPGQRHAVGVAGDSGLADAGGLESEPIAPQHLRHLLRQLRLRLLSGSVDGTWMQATFPHWRASLRRIMVNAQIKRLEAERAEAEGRGGEGEGEEGAGEEAQEEEEEEEEEEDEEEGTGGATKVSQAAVEAILGAAAGWCIEQRAVTTGTMSLLRQVRRRGLGLCLRL